MINAARRLALKYHQDQYGVHPYIYHLEQVVNCCYQHIDCVELEQQTNVICAAYLHDLIEDYGNHLQEILNITNSTVASMVLALTTIGRTRQEKFSESYFQNLSKNKHAVFIKLCDRLCNIRECLLTGNQKLLKMYQKEQTLVSQYLSFPEFQPLLDSLNQLIVPEYA